MSNPEITMDGPENPQRDPSRRTDLSSALAWRRSAPSPEPATDPRREPTAATADSDVEPDGYTEPNGYAEPNGAAGDSEDDTWTPPEPWSPPAWSPPAAWPPSPAEQPPPADEPRMAQQPSMVDQPPMAGHPPTAEPSPTDLADAGQWYVAEEQTEWPAAQPSVAGPQWGAVEAPAAGSPRPGVEPLVVPAAQWAVTKPETVDEAAVPAPTGQAWPPPSMVEAHVVETPIAETQVVEAQVIEPVAEEDLVPADVDAADMVDAGVVEAGVVDADVVDAPAAYLEASTVDADPTVGDLTASDGAPGPYERQEALHVATGQYPLVSREPAALPADGMAESSVDGDAMTPPPVPPEELPPIDAILPRAEGYREVGFDTVHRSLATAAEFQPYRELGLEPDEYARIKQILGRRPTESELAMYAVMWSEHCSYKSSKVHLRQFAELAERIKAQNAEKGPRSDRMLAGMGANAGVVRVSDRLAVTFKVESHNHPSFVEPHQGAATGVGGIVRDILAMGARPVAVMDPLRFGEPDHEDTRRVLPGVVAGIGGYGNCLGLPNIGGEVVFDECYQGNPLVNALCVGVLPVDKLQQKAANGPGNVVVLIGAKTGRDGIGGVSVLASSTFGQGSENRRPSVQVGDPFLEKLLIEACLEIYDLNLVAGIQDLGGAGLTCALSEMAAAAGQGMAVNLDLVPLREPSMRAEEVLVSESQERMLLVVTPENLPVVLSICARWGVLATAIGEVTAPEAHGSGQLRIWWRGEVIVDVPPGSLADDGPVYARPMREPFERELMKVDRPETLPRPESAAQLRETLLRMAGSPNLCDKGWVTEQYDRYVLGNTVLAQPEDSGVIRVDEATGLGIALSVDGNGRYARLDPYIGAKLALAEAYRNVAVTGAAPVAVTDCLNFGSPEDPGVMWQFAETVRGLADGCAELGIPVTGGNVSFYNQTGGNPIHPTPVVGVLGVFEDVARRVPMGFSGEGDAIFLLGQTRDELGGSEWAHVTHRHLGGEPPAVDLAAEQRLAGLLAEAARLGYLTAAHDLSEGGLAQGLTECCLRRNMGAHVALPPDGQSPFVHLFSESSARALVSVRKGQEQAFASLADRHGVPKNALGIVAGTSLVFDELFEVDLDELRRAHTATLPALFG